MSSGTTTTTTTTTPDYFAITQRQQTVWASGDYAAVAAKIQVMSELLCDAAAIAPGMRVLDVAGGSGNTALAAARSGAEVTSLDYVAQLQERGRARAAAEGLQVEWVTADAQAMPFPEASFDAVISVVGVMFAPDQSAAATELLTVCRPGGTIALASWTPEGFIGGLLRTVGAHVPPPAGLKPPTRWGTEDGVRELLGDGVEDVWIRRRTFRWRFASPSAFTTFFRTLYGPTVAAFSALDDAGQARLAADIDALIVQYAPEGAGGGPVTIPADYLEVVARRT